MTTVVPMNGNNNKGFEESDDTDDDTGIYTPSPLPVPGKEDPPVPSRVTYMEPGMSPRGDVPLHQCARNGYVEETRKLLEDPQVQADINNVDEEHQAALHYAARYNHYEIVKLLIEHKAEVNIEDDEGLTPLHYACRTNRKRKKKSKSTLDFFENSASPIPQGLSPSRKRTDPEAACIHYLISNGACITQGDDYKQTPLHHAALRGDEVACEQLLLYQTPELTLVHAKDIQDMTPLHTAVCQSHTEIVRMLIKAGADLRSVDDELSTALHEAAAVDCVKTVKLILNACKKEVSGYTEQELLSDKDEDGNTPLMLAIESGSLDTAILLIDRGSSVSSTNKFLHTPLHLAAISGTSCLPVLRYLLEKGANVEAYNHEHQTPLHKAALFNNLECMKTLLDAGADIEVKDRDNFTPLLLAACYGHAAAVELLINNNTNIMAEDKNDRTALFLAAEEDRVEVLEVLLKSGLLKDRINQKDKNSDAPLHVAALSGHIDVVKCLCDHGADIFCRNDLEKTAIHVAAQGGHVNVIKELASRDPSCINDGDEDSNTALHLAAMEGNVKVVHCLLMIGADVNVRNGTLRTPFACAAEKGFVKTNKMLRNFDSQIDLLDKLKLTPLLVAAMNGHSEVVKFLLDEKVNLSTCDPNGNNCLDLAIINDHNDVAFEIIKSNRWEEALRNTTDNNGIVDTPLRKLIRKMPEVAQEVFNRCIREQKQEKDKEGSQQSLNDRYDVIMNYEFLDDMYTINEWKKPKKFKRRQEKNLKAEKLRDPYTRDTEIFKKNHPMMIMVTSDRDELLNHPLVRSLLNYKWRTFGRVFYYVNFLTFMIFLAFLTGYVAVTPPPYLIDKSSLSSFDGDSDCKRYQNSGAKHHVFAAVGKYFILVQAFLSILKEVFQAYHAKLHYITWENMLEVVLFLSAVLFCLDYEDCQRITGYRTEWQWYFGTIAIFLTWLEFVLFIQKFPMFGIYVVMFKNILNTFFRFFIVFLIFIIAFGMGFFCLLQNQTPYATVWQSILRTTVMMIGEFDYNDIFHGDDYVAYWLTYILMTVFIVVMSIIIMNLLVGLAVDDIKGVLDKAALKRMAMQVDLVLDVERIFPRFYSRYYLVEETICTKTQEEAAAIVKPVEQFENEVQKSQKKVLRKVDKMKDGMKDLRRNMTRIEFMLDAIVKAQNININMDDA